MRCISSHSANVTITPAPAEVSYATCAILLILQLLFYSESCRRNNGQRKPFPAMGDEGGVRRLKRLGSPAFRRPQEGKNRIVFTATAMIPAA
jgi:hypothetical protein